MVTMVTMSKRLSFYIFRSSQIALANQPVHVRMTLNILLISISVKQLLDFRFCRKMPLFSMSVYRDTRSHTGCVLILFHLEIIGVQQKLSGIFVL